MTDEIADIPQSYSDNQPVWTGSFIQNIVWQRNPELSLCSRLAAFWV